MTKIETKLAKTSHSIWYPKLTDDGLFVKRYSKVKCPNTSEMNNVYCLVYQTNS
jgi:hypothetical protein